VAIFSGLLLIIVSDSFRFIGLPTFRLLLVLLTGRAVAVVLLVP
jgi:hypothetical protein